MEVSKMEMLRRLGENIVDRWGRVFRVEGRTTRGREDRVKSDAKLFARAEHSIKIVTDPEGLKETIEALREAKIIQQEQKTKEQ